MDFWTNKKILITGGSGFLGGHLQKELEKKRPQFVRPLDIKDGDLTDYKATLNLIHGFDIVIHLAAKVAGIGFNKTHPVEMFEENMAMGMNIIKASNELRVKKLVFIGTICSYPKFAQIPFNENDLWSGYPEETNAPYGIAKKSLLVLLQAYKEQFGLNGIFLMPVNMYGPGDNFNPESSHVIPALIRRMVNAKINELQEVVVWGTGNATREFLYVEDSAEAIVKATEFYDSQMPINVGSGMEIKISELAKMIKEIVGYKGKIVWDKSKPDGQPRRSVDVTRAKQKFGFVAKTKLIDGLAKTIEWYTKNKSNEK